MSGLNRRVRRHQERHDDTPDWLEPGLAIAEVISHLAARHDLRAGIVTPEASISGHAEVVCLDDEMVWCCAGCGEELLDAIAGTSYLGEADVTAPVVLVRAICADCHPPTDMAAA